MSAQRYAVASAWAREGDDGAQVIALLTFCVAVSEKAAIRDGTREAAHERPDFAMLSAVARAIP